MTSKARRVGIDVGGTKALGVALDAAGEVVADVQRPTPRGDDSLEPLVATLAGSAVLLVAGSAWSATAPSGPPDEPISIAEAGKAAHGATAYVTLEPCAHHGVTPPE